MRIIPAIDIIGGKAVRLEKGDYDKKKIYDDEPLEVAKRFEGAGIKYLHLVDLDGAKQGQVINLKILEGIKSRTSLTVDFGGGIRSLSDMRSLFDAGADQVNIGSLSVKDPDKILAFVEVFSADKIILSPDVKNKKIAVSGWQETSKKDVFEYISEFRRIGIANYVCTDIEKDGMLTGSSIDLYKEILERQGDINLIASGGVKGIDELKALKDANLYGVIIGKAIYEGKILLKDLEQYVS